jgi:hypothetical protein
MKQSSSQSSHSHAELDRQEKKTHYALISNEEVVQSHSRIKGFVSAGDWLGILLFF